MKAIKLFVFLCHFTAEVVLFSLTISVAISSDFRNAFFLLLAFLYNALLLVVLYE